MGKAYKIGGKNLKEASHLGYIGVYRKLILKFILNRVK
jgi:hypothetical protein